MVENYLKSLANQLRAVTHNTAKYTTRNINDYLTYFSSPVYSPAIHSEYTLSGPVTSTDGTNYTITGKGAMINLDLTATWPPRDLIEKLHNNILQLKWTFNHPSYTGDDFVQHRPAYNVKLVDKENNQQFLHVEYVNEQSPVPPATSLFTFLTTELLDSMYNNRLRIIYDFAYDNTPESRLIINPDLSLATRN